MRKEGSYPSAEMQSLYSTAAADRVVVHSKNYRRDFKLKIAPHYK